MFTKLFYDFSDGHLNATHGKRWGPLLPEGIKTVAGRGDSSMAATPTELIV